MIAVWSYMGLACSLFVLATWITDKKKRATQIRIIHFSFSTSLLALSFVAVEIGGAESVWCKNNVESNDGGECLVQGFFFMFFSLSSAFWWFFIGLQTYSSILGSHYVKLIDKQERAITGVAYGYPLLMAVIALVNGNLTHGSANMFGCFIHGTEEWYLFYPALGAMILGGALLVGRILIYVLQHMRRSRHTMPDEITRKNHEVVVRLAMFMTIYLLTYSIIMAYRLTGEYEYDEYLDSGYAWVRCLFIARSGDYHAICGDRPEHRFPIGLYHLTLMCVPGCGIGVFLVYGTKRAHLHHWGRVLRRGYAWITSDPDFQDLDDSSRSRLSQGSSHSKRSSVAGRASAGDRSSVGLSRGGNKRLSTGGRVRELQGSHGPVGKPSSSSAAAAISGAGGGGGGGGSATTANPMLATGSARPGSYRGAHGKGAPFHSDLSPAAAAAGRGSNGAAARAGAGGPGAGASAEMVPLSAASGDKKPGLLSHLLPTRANGAGGGDSAERMTCDLNTGVCSTEPVLAPSASGKAGLFSSVMSSRAMRSEFSEPPGSA